MQASRSRAAAADDKPVNASVSLAGEGSTTHQAYMSFMISEKQRDKSLIFIVLFGVLTIAFGVVATSRNNLALLLQDQGRMGEAEPLYREALEVCPHV